jgi:hypothetical protein
VRLSAKKKSTITVALMRAQTIRTHFPQPHPWTTAGSSPAIVRSSPPLVVVPSATPERSRLRRCLQPDAYNNRGGAKWLTMQKRFFILSHDARNSNHISISRFPGWPCPVNGSW